VFKTCFVQLDTKHLLNRFFVGLIYQGRVGQTAFAVGRFFGQNVTFKSVLSLDFAGTGKLETLFGTGLRFHLRHCYSV
jgi:hypothetical protein